MSEPTKTALPLGTYFQQELEKHGLTITDVSEKTKYTEKFLREVIALQKKTIAPHACWTFDIVFGFPEGTFWAVEMAYRDENSLHWDESTRTYGDRKDK
jgi:hypothetical protein